MSRVSVLTPCYQAALYVERTVCSVQAQTLTDWEMVGSDDGSKDHSSNLVESLAARDSRIHLIRQPHSGVCRARNRAYAASDPTAEYLLLLDADDTLESKMLQTLTAHRDRNPAVGMVYTEPRRVDTGDNPLSVSDDQTPGGRRWCARSGRAVRIPRDVAETPFASVFAWNGIVPSVSLLLRSAYAPTEGFGHLFEDTDVFLAMALLGPIHYLPLSLVNCRIHGGQATSNERKLWVQERRMYVKWLLSIAGCAAAHLSRIAEARKFREGIPMPHLRLLWAVQNVRRGSIAEADRQALRSVRHLLTCALGVRTLARAGGGC